MSGKRTKPLSFEEKRSRVLELFHETQDFWQLKEIEKMSFAKKGVVLQSVKEVVDSLVSDNLVCMEKIGISNYYWAFTSAIVKQLEDMEAKRDTLKAEMKTLEEKISSERDKRPAAEVWEKLQKQINKELALNTKLKDQISQHDRLDPELLNKKTRAIEIAKASVNRWIENIFAIRSYCCQNFNISIEDFNKQFNVPSNLDLVD